MKQSSILDPIHAELTPYLWDDPESDEPLLKIKLKSWFEDLIYKNSDKFYSDSASWIQLMSLTGSLTTYQYSNQSDCDIHIFLDSTVLPDWDRAKLMAILVENCDGKIVPGTPYILQTFVMSPQIPPELHYQTGLRSGYDIVNNSWIVPPERSRSHDVEAEYTDLYISALQVADKLEILIRHQPKRALKYYHFVHTKKQKEQDRNQGDFGKWNIIFKMLLKKGIVDQIWQLKDSNL